MKVVLDTNVWVSAWLWRGLPGQLIALARNNRIVLCSSSALLEELKVTLSYEKLQQKINSLDLTIAELLMGTEELVTIYSIVPLEVPELRDSDDRIVLATAIAAEADVIITGDKDLLILSVYENIPIMTVNNFLQNYGFNNS